MHLAHTASDHLSRAEGLRKVDDPVSLTYAALELRLGIEAKLKEYVANAIGLSKTQSKEWEIKKLGRTLAEKYGLGHEVIQLIFVKANGQHATFMHAPVSTRLQDIGKKCGNYLHWKEVVTTVEEAHWQELREIVHEGCGLLQLSCASEVLRPSFSDGLHFTLKIGDPRVPLVQALSEGIAAEFEVFDFNPAGTITYKPAETG